MGRRVGMELLVNRAKSFLRSEEGPTATEYAVMLALIIMVALAAIGAIGDKVTAMFTGLTTTLGVTGY
jgi:pilus assembly protein Flp/PilA